MNEFIIPVLLTAVSGYLLGSINSAILVSRLLKQEDIRHFGSGNAGVTNVYRTYGKIPALITLLGDFFKAALAVLLARGIFYYLGLATLPDPGYLAGLFALRGHIFPIYFGFKGGKGVMPLIGVLFFVNLPLLGVLMAVALPLVLITRKMSLGSLLSALLMPIAGYFLGKDQGDVAVTITVYLSAYALLVLFSHRGNIKRLLSGTENSLTSKKP